MTSQPLNYALPDTSPRRAAFAWKTIGAALAALLVIVCVPTITVEQVTTRIDAVTGTVSRTSVWPLGIVSSPRRDVSPLETRLNAAGVAWSPTWRTLNENGYTMVGTATYRGCSTAPTIYQLRPIMKEFVAASTDDELRAFVRVMQTGTDAQQQAAVDAAVGKVFRAANDDSTEASTRSATIAAN